MTRTKKKTKPKADLSKPIDVSAITLREGDCFGREWSLESTECQFCAAVDLCGTIVSQGIKEEAKRKSKKEKYLDESDFKSIDPIQFLKETSGTDVAGMLDTLMMKANTDDRNTAISVLENILRQHFDKIKRNKDGTVEFSG